MLLSAGVIPVVEALAGPGSGLRRFLLLRAYRHWDFPKGLVEKGERPLDAALRELTEETGVETVELVWGLEYFETAPYNRGKRARYYLGRTVERDLVLPVSDELGRPEHDEYRWVSAEEAAALLVPRVQAALGWAIEKLNAPGVAQ